MKFRSGIAPIALEPDVAIPARLRELKRSMAKAEGR